MKLPVCVKLSLSSLRIRQKYLLPNIVTEDGNLIRTYKLTRGGVMLWLKNGQAVKSW